jgi:hypothetical protein
VVEMMEREAFKDAYPKASDQGWHQGETTEAQGWYLNNSIAVAEYFWIEHREETLVRLADGQVLVDPKGIPPEAIVAKRTRQVPDVMWAKITARDVLEGPQKVPGKFIPVVPVVGEELHLDDRAFRTSVVRHGRDSQIAYNYMRSAQIEVIALQPKAPYLLTANQIKGHAPMWAKAGTDNLPYLVYNPDAQAPAPARIQPPVASQALMAEIQMAAEELKATTGIYDASLGARSNETSGVAIEQRKIEGQRSTSIYVDNLALSIEHCGNILVGMIPEVYDTERVVRILGDDGAETAVTVNQEVMTERGPDVVNNLRVGRYDVRVTTGPTFATLREEAATSMFELIKAMPQAGPMIADLMAENMNWPKAQQVADRLKKMVPPGVIDVKPEEMTPEQQQAMQAQQAQAQQQQAMQADMLPQQQQKFMADLEETMAKTRKTNADADNSALEAAEKQMELAVKNGLLDEAIRTAVARALQSANAPIGAF